MSAFLNGEPSRVSGRLKHTVARRSSRSLRARHYLQKKNMKPRITWRGRAATTKKKAKKELVTEETREKHGKMQGIECPYSPTLFRVCSVFLP
jgi:hypothetical protein